MYFEWTTSEPAPGIAAINYPESTSMFNWVVSIINSTVNTGCFFYSNYNRMTGNYLIAIFIGNLEIIRSLFFTPTVFYKPASTTVVSWEN